MKLMLRYIRRHFGMFFTAISFLCVEAMADLLQPTFMAHIVDEGVKGADISIILRYGLIMIGIAAVGAVGAVMRNIYASFTGYGEPYFPAYPNHYPAHPQDVCRAAEDPGQAQWAD